MPVLELWWSCRICGRRYIGPEAYAEAVACERRGRPKVPPIGCIVRDDPNYLGHGHVALLQAVGVVHEKDTDGHYVGAAFWTWRDDLLPLGPMQIAGCVVTRVRRGDSAPGSDALTTGPTIGLGTRLVLDDLDATRRTARYARAVRDMRAAGVNPTIWLDGAAVPAPEPLEAR